MNISASFSDLSTLVLVAVAILSCASSDGPGGLGPYVGTPLDLSSDDIRPGAIIVEKLKEGGYALPPRIMCTADTSIGQPDASGVDKLTDSTLGQLDSSKLEEFRASAEVKVLEMVKAKAGANSTIKARARLENVHRFEISTAALSYRLCHKKRAPMCTAEINNSNDKVKRSIIVSALLADLVYEFTSSQGTSGDVGVNLEEVKVELGAGYKVEAGKNIRGTGLTIAYTSLKQDDPVSDADRFFWPDDMCKNYPITPQTVSSPPAPITSPAAPTSNGP